MNKTICWNLYDLQVQCIKSMLCVHAWEFLPNWSNIYNLYPEAGCSFINARCRCFCFTIILKKKNDQTVRLKNVHISHFISFRYSHVLSFYTLLIREIKNGSLILDISWYVFHIAAASWRPSNFTQRSGVGSVLLLGVAKHWG